MSPEKEAAIIWAGMLSQRLAIRSVLELDERKSHFETEITFVTDEAGNPDGGIFRLEIKRYLGLSIERPVTRLQELDVSVPGFLAGMRDRIPIRNRKIAELLLEPRPHVAIVRSRANGEIVLPPSHPLLMPYYGMVNEALTTQHHENQARSREKSLYGVLKRRFGAFLYQQEETAIENTLGELIV